MGRPFRKPRQCSSQLEIVTDPPVKYSETQSWTSSSLLERARATDQEAWNRLVSLYAPLVLMWCRRWNLNPEDTENVSQEVFLSVAGNLNAYRHDLPGSTFRGWLWTICRNKAIDLLRAGAPPASAPGGSDARTRLEQVPAQTSEGDDSARLSEERSLLLQRAIELIQSEFSQRDWQIFHSIVADGRRPDAVAEEIGVSRNTVYLVKSRVLKRVRDEFSGLIDDLDAGNE